MRILRFFIGVVLLPLCYAVTRTVVLLIGAIHPAASASIPPAAWALVGGFALWLLVYFTLPRPVRGYILAHELTHALWGSLMGARVLKMKVSRDKGSVTLSKSNFFITLAPYFFPLYTVLAIAAYYVLSVFFALERYYPWWLGVIGFTWGFHLVFTIATLLQHQTDIQQCGRVFSYAVIYLLNVVGISFWIVVVSAATLEQMVEFTGENVTACTGAFWSALVRAAEMVRDLV